MGRGPARSCWHIALHAHHRTPGCQGELQNTASPGGLFSGAGPQGVRFPHLGTPSRRGRLGSGLVTGLARLLVVAGGVVPGSRQDGRGVGRVSAQPQPPGDTWGPAKSAGRGERAGPAHPAALRGPSVSGGGRRPAAAARGRGTGGGEAGRRNPTNKTGIAQRPARLAWKEPARKERSRESRGSARPAGRGGRSRYPCRGAVAGPGRAGPDGAGTPRVSANLCSPGGSGWRARTRTNQMRGLSGPRRPPCTPLSPPRAAHIWKESAAPGGGGSGNVGGRWNGEGRAASLCAFACPAQDS